MHMIPMVVVLGGLLLPAEAGAGESPAHRMPPMAWGHLLTLAGGFGPLALGGMAGTGAGAPERLRLPAPSPEETLPVGEAIRRRRSVRRFQDEPLTPDQLSFLFWAAQGITDPAQGLRAAPSAGATYPLDLALVSSAGTFWYRVPGHELERVGERDLRADIARASLDQAWMRQAGAIVVVVATPERTTRRYGDRGHRFIAMEAGHVAQNIHLAAVSLGLGSVPVGAFSDRDVARILGLGEGQEALYIICVGRATEP